MEPVEPADAGPPEKPAYLDVIGPAGPSTPVPLVDSPMVVGRVAECNLRLDHLMVSRQHARFESRNGRWQIIDLNSHNGTRVNKKSVQDHLLHDGDCVDIGPFTLTFHHRPRIAPSQEPPMVLHPPVLAVNDQTVAIRTLHEIQPPHIAVEHLNGLEGFTRVLMDTEDAGDRLAALCRLMVQSGFGGRWAVAVSVFNAGTDPVVLSPVQFAEGSNCNQASPYLSRSLLQAVFRRREPMLASNSQGGGNGGLELSISPDVMMITAIAIPLPSSDLARADLLYAVFPPEYGTGEWLALSTLAVNHYRQAETIWANIHRNLKLATLEADLERARRVQDRLVPKSVQLPGLDLAVRFKPCSAVGGDYVDVLPLPQGRALLVVADVCGKGLSAAMVAMGIHTLVHAAARRWAGLDDLVATASAHLVETLPMDSFVTFLAITLDPATGELEVANGGHPPALIVDRAGKTREFGQATTVPLGYAFEPPTVDRGQLVDGETMVLFTDGCCDIKDASGEMLGIESFCGQAANHLTGHAASISVAADRLMVALDDFQGAGLQPDDRTMLLVRRETPTAAGQRVEG